jgi:hypothetical protein
MIYAPSATINDFMIVMIELAGCSLWNSLLLIGGKLKRVTEILNSQQKPTLLSRF